MSSPLDQLKPTAPAPKPEPPSASPPITPEDAGSQALSDALRSSFAIVRIVMVILVVVFFASGIFTVPSQEKAIVLRFGRPVGATPDEQLLRPGLHWSFPYPIDEVVHIPITQVQTVTSTTGWYATTPEAEASNSEPEPGMSLNPASDGYTLTGDGNIIHMRMMLKYRINNPLDYVLNFVNASNVVQNALDSALIHVSTQFTVDQALRLEVTALRERILADVRSLVDERGLGITIDNDPVLQTLAPRQVKKAFADVIAADQDRGKSVSEAQGYANSVRNRAAGEAQIVVNDGKTDADRLLQSVSADAQSFQDQLPHYRKNPELFLARLQTEALQRILTNAQDKILRMDNGERAMWIQLNREPLKPAAPKKEGPAQSPPSR
jgi:membrane protease subunit HflK